LTAPPLLYDAARALHYRKPLLRGWLHLVFFLASLAVNTVFVLAVSGGLRTFAVAVYAVSVSGLFGVSALYHRGNWTAPASRLLQRLDHLMIFVLIAGSATPAFLLGVRGTGGVAAAVALWTVTLLLVVVHLCWMQAPEVLVGGTFIGLGVLAGLALPAMWARGGLACGSLMLAGGVLYIVGAVSYHRRRPDPSPAVFGYHEVFHTYVCLAATCHYVAIALLATR